jgi:hypothetical protein
MDIMGKKKCVYIYNVFISQFLKEKKNNDKLRIETHQARVTWFPMGVWIQEGGLAHTETHAKENQEK